MRLPVREQIERLHRRALAHSGGQPGIRNFAGLESAIAQPAMTFDGVDLNATLADKAAALGYSLIMNHPFIDGNKRVGHAAVELLLLLNGCELNGNVDEQEAVILAVASGNMSRVYFTEWIRAHIIALIYGIYDLRIRHI